MHYRLTFGSTTLVHTKYFNLDGVNLTHKEFYEKLIECDTLPVTSQIPPYDFEEAIRKVTDTGDYAIIITLSSKLSGTYQSACIAASEFEGKAFVVDGEVVMLGKSRGSRQGNNLLAEHIKSSGGIAVAYFAVSE